MTEATRSRVRKDSAARATSATSRSAMGILRGQRRRNPAFRARASASRSFRICRRRLWSSVPRTCAIFLRCIGGSEVLESPGLAVGFWGPPELAGQLAQAGIGLASQSLSALKIALESGADLGNLAFWQGQDVSFAPLAVRQGGRGVRFTLATTAVGFATFAAQPDEGAAQNRGDS